MPTELALDLDRPTAFLKLMVHDVTTPATSVAEIKKRLEGLPLGYFPRDFEIVDACLTNADGIWLFKHFYL